MFGVDCSANCGSSDKIGMVFKRNEFFLVFLTMKDPEKSFQAFFRPSTISLPGDTYSPAFSTNRTYKTKII